jgi:hypothetical protein
MHVQIDLPGREKSMYPKEWEAMNQRHANEDYDGRMHHFRIKLYRSCGGKSIEWLDLLDHNPFLMEQSHNPERGGSEYSEEGGKSSKCQSN